MQNVGTISVGVKMPVLKAGDKLVEEIIKSCQQASQELNIPFEDGDIVSVTESIVARCYGEYLTVDAISEELKRLYNTGNKISHLIVYQPVLSRNRFAVVLRAIARACNKVTILFSAPTDEVGNEIVPRDWYMFMKYNNELTSDIVQGEANEFQHPFTGVNYISYYRDIVQAEGCVFDYIISEDLVPCVNDKNVLICNVHDRELYRTLLDNDTRTVHTLQDVYGLKNFWGLLGCNKVDEETVKLFPSNGETFVTVLKEAFNGKLGKNVECMIYGDGGFKCPVCGVWEELDPVISPAFTCGLDKVPNEIKLKYFADNKYSDYSGDILTEKIREEIQQKDAELVGNMTAQGTTPRRIPDLLGSLSDLTSGSGDKGTPVVWIKNYFKNYADA